MSSTPSKRQNLALAPSKEELEALEELANVQDEEGADRFLTRWPEFLEDEQLMPTVWHILPADPTSAAAQSGVQFEAYPLPTATSQELIEAANIVALNVASDLQKIWRDDPVEGKSLLAKYLLEWEPWQYAYAPAPDRPADMFATQITESMIPPVRPDWRRGGFVYSPRTRLQRALYWLLKHSSLAKVCANPECPAPYFIARRTIQRYCGDDCAAPARLEAKMRWWNREGKQARKARVRRQKQRNAKK